MTTVLFLHLTTNAKDETMSTLSETQWLSFSGGSFIEIIRDHIPSRCIHFRHIFAFQTSRTFQVSQQQQAIGAKATTVRHGIRLFLRRRGLPGQSWPTGIQGTRSGGPNDEPLLQHQSHRPGEQTHGTHQGKESSNDCGVDGQNWPDYKKLSRNQTTTCY